MPIAGPAALGALCALVACGSASDADGARAASAASGAVPFRVITNGSIPDEGRGGGARGRLVRSRAGAASVLRSWDLERALPAARKLDYARRSLVIVLAGSVPDTAYRLAARRVSVGSRRVRVSAELQRRAGAIGGQAISRPYTLLSVDRDDVAGAGTVASVQVSGP